MSHKMDTNKLEKHYWIWPIAWYLFLGGLGGGILFAAGILDMVFHAGYILALGVLFAVACLGIGSMLLIFELGQPKVFLRVFLSATAIIKWGACLLILAMGFGFIYFLFWLPPEWNLFWYPWLWIRDLCAVLMALFGLCVVVYTGVLLSTMKAKPFWNTPVLPVLFTVSALSTATAALALLAGMWPSYEYILAMIGSDAMAQAMAGEVLHANKEVMMEILHIADKILVIAEIVVLLLYVLTTRASGNLTAKAVALEWISGKKALLFWVGMMLCGLTIPFLLYQLGGVGAEYVAPVLVLAAGLLLRFMIVYSDRRRSMPGEEQYYRRLPKGDERFLQGWKAPY
ncbi:MAG: polysulfide reductase NrfD [Coriobacteriales bacterium]|jgi:polysulfide reductase chain C|nr:polysulfide reductase NrfD [Coriobacteriales bacterium]